MPVGVNPEGGAVVHEEMIEDERLQNRNAATAVDVQQRDTVVKRRK
jgi:hypothetical protein